MGGELRFFAGFPALRRHRPYAVMGASNAILALLSLFGACGHLEA